MDQNDRHAIDGLFGKLKQVEGQTGPRDGEAETFINQRVASQPAAPYFMAQTIVVQEQALEAAQRRIEELEHQASARPAGGGGFFSSMFGSNSQPRQQPANTAAYRGGAPATAGAYGNQGHAQNAYADPNGQADGQQGGQSSGPWGRQGAAQRGPMGGGGGFLAGAAQTAMGVAGGVLIGNAIMGMMGGNEAQAAETPAPEPAQPAEDADTGMDDGGDDMDF
ncbi:DUF2076 family protein [Rhizobiales bacterium RZME27]|uniref:DUF2076 family protein n=1 Tax=Endobacterium cereale TaxID=2663029 RepID=A0A6A8AFJ3_9HYPH|nr:DUF2076 domain-containing protein [Endobacterium cereale]MEB2847565.1 DUF2076 domain-containing protein [Endobacterium cereale]MQY47976.1 DUF2076 family protein [Endobacterium cereale]